jgi:hypothetical protein
VRYRQPVGSKWASIHGTNWASIYGTNRASIYGSNASCRLRSTTRARALFSPIPLDLNTNLLFISLTGGVCSATLPFFGVVPIVLDAEGNEITETECSGYLAIKQSWPGQMRTIYNDHERFEQTYFTLYNAESKLISDRFYITGDGCPTRSRARGFTPTLS